MFRISLFALWMMACCGCSSLGITFYPTGHFLTDQSEAVLDASPRQANLAKELSKGVMPVHYLEPGDVLLIEPVDFESEIRIPADQHVLADGSIDLGGFGRAVIAGLTLEAAEELIEQTIVHSGEEEVQINIRLLEAVHRYYVLGEVNSPGAYPLEGHETVLDAIMAAGGLTGDASPCKLLLARPTMERSCRITLPVCYREITQLGDSSTNYQIEPGDRVFVSSRTFCEELKCCLATETCERCCKCQSPCPDPSLVQRGNPYPRIDANRATTTWRNKAADEPDPSVDRLTNPLTDAPSSDLSGTSGIRDRDLNGDAFSQDAPELPIRRLPLVGDGSLPREFERQPSLTRPNLVDPDAASGQLIEPLDGQLAPRSQPPSIPNQFDE